MLTRPSPIPGFSPKAVYKILRLHEHGKDQLEQADFLAEYDAIALDPSWVLFGIEPGRHVTWPQVDNNLYNFHAMEVLLNKRSTELWPFFAHGGLLVVRLIEPARLQIGGFKQILDSFGWWYDTAARASAGGMSPMSGYIQAGTGQVRVLEPGHPFESYLRATTTYRARITGGHSRLVALAENRTGEPVAAEIPCQQGALFLVPPPTDDGGEYLLQGAIYEALKSRLGVAHEWTVAEEGVLADQRDAALREMREKRREIEQRLATTRERKEAVLAKLHVDRVIGKYRIATNGTPVAKVSVPALWSMTELLREHYNKGTATLAAMLNLPREDLEFIDALANNRDLDLRHTTGGQPKPVEPGELQRALAIGRAVVGAVIEYEYRASVATPVAGLAEIHPTTA